MSHDPTRPPNVPPPPPPGAPLPPPAIVIQQPSERGRFRTRMNRLLTLLLAVSIIINFVVIGVYSEYISDTEPPYERFRSGEIDSDDKIAVIEVSGTISPPFTDDVLDAIEQARKDDDVKGVVLTVDSPGGLVADSHMIYHELKRLSAVKPVHVSMKRLAASGGYYIAMGAGEKGTIYAEPTTWTGSIGVIIPRYNVSKLVSDMGVKVEPMTTGPYKDALSPFRDLSPEETEIWKTIMQESYDRFLSVIDDNRANLDRAQVQELATGQVYTAEQAHAKGLVDKIGYEDDAIDALKSQLGLKDARVVTYEHPKGMLSMLLGAEQPTPTSQVRELLELTVPRAMYFCSWAPDLLTLR